MFNVRTCSRHVKWGMRRVCDVSSDRDRIQTSSAKDRDAPCHLAGLSQAFGIFVAPKSFSWSSKKIFRLFFQVSPKIRKDFCAGMFLLFHIFLFFFSCLFWFPLNPPICPVPNAQGCGRWKRPCRYCTSIAGGQSKPYRKCFACGCGEGEDWGAKTKKIGSFWSHISFWGGSKNFRLMLIFNAEKMYEKGYCELQNPHSWLNEDGKTSAVMILFYLLFFEGRQSNDCDIS